ncbi:MAG: alanine racemase [Bacilli bacterium]|nr:alanine racemase [Bacilli bacterium]MDD3304528.1 alanine racemase [Bacilli bacterium]MDD4053908.1 alanine racemase [Bacilli bacterium]MDD4411277.1 alanine racemase [Bacilli bacterium]
MKRTNCVINLGNLRYNVDQIKKHTGKKIIAVVKADAYGHGAINVVKALEGKVEYFAVACFEEASELRKNGVLGSILILGHTESNKFNEAASKNITITIHDLSQLQNISLNKRLKVHLKVDTGMNRIGLSNIDDINKAISLIEDNSNLYLEGIFTHYATADCDEDFYLEQRARFEFVIKSLDYEFEYIHSSNSAASINYGDDLTNTVRPGIIMYGISPNEITDFSLKPVLSLYSNVIQLKEVLVGQRIGYGNCFIAKENMLIATVSIGYGDGWLRRNSVVPVYINNNYYEIVGRICMDMLMVKVDVSVKLGDIVELIGPHIDTATVALKTETISYEVLCALGNRVERNYIEDEK